MQHEKLIRRGAEAEILLSDYMGRPVVLKRRVRKSYRTEEIDFRLRSYRTRDEAKLLHEARRAGVNVPVIYDVDVQNGQITMEYVEGKRVKDALHSMARAEMEALCMEVGRSVARLHNANLIHGDLTTSNMILSDGKVVFIDFGLGAKTESVEDRGVDLHVLMEAFESTHSERPDCFENAWRGYEDICWHGAAAVRQKIDDIIRRGRYRS
ncbi:MAG: Kae1-associated kinase Bud32 [Thermoplasmata archaeon HGW-Thermoplasmata-1]|nr:MAG: Kae1-associated kinase Bud32 [Thermoplasmata archaeon HGW-Thermoplasmata-1]